MARIFRNSNRPKIALPIALRAAWPRTILFSLRCVASIHEWAWRPYSIPSPERSEELLALDAALDRLAIVEPQAAELVQLRYFAGCTLEESAELLGLPLRSTQRLWAYVKAWLLEALSND